MGALIMQPLEALNVCSRGLRIRNLETWNKLVVCKLVMHIAEGRDSIHNHERYLKGADWTFVPKTDVSVLENYVM